MSMESSRPVNRDDIVEGFGAHAPSSGKGSHILHNNPQVQSQKKTKKALGPATSLPSPSSAMTGRGKKASAVPSRPSAPVVAMPRVTTTALATTPTSKATAVVGMPRTLAPRTVPFSPPVRPSAVVVPGHKRSREAMQAGSAAAKVEILEPPRKRLLRVLSEGEDGEEVPPVAGMAADAEVVTAEAPDAEATIAEALDAEAAVAEALDAEASIVPPAAEGPASSDDLAELFASLREEGCSSASVAPLDEDSRATVEQLREFLHMGVNHMANAQTFQEFRSCLDTAMALGLLDLAQLDELQIRLAEGEKMINRYAEAGMRMTEGCSLEQELAVIKEQAQRGNEELAQVEAQIAELQARRELILERRDRAVAASTELKSLAKQILKTTTEKKALAERKVIRARWLADMDKGDIAWRSITCLIWRMFSDGI